MKQDCKTVFIEGKTEHSMTTGELSRTYMWFPRLDSVASDFSFPFKIQRKANFGEEN